MRIMPVTVCRPRLSRAPVASWQKMVNVGELKSPRKLKKTNEITDELDVNMGESPSECLSGTLLIGRFAHYLNKQPARDTLRTKCP
ncbi:hypothetical protein BMS3Bbin04_00805 [bacterium BMS3Bbin04]|nr:hypothetical protein BMS3Bbin04_00805 [bacterium BMS3Bbin04]